jgi:hypothetical protein
MVLMVMSDALADRDHELLKACQVVLSADVEVMLAASERVVDYSDFRGFPLFPFGCGRISTNQETYVRFLAKVLGDHENKATSTDALVKVVPAWGVR